MSFQFPAAGLAFLRELASNNNKDWFHANKARYEHDLKLPARELCAAINGELSRIAPSHVSDPAKAINRINRDIRFSKDKSPYNTKVWAGFTDHSRGKGNSAGFYFGFGVDGDGSATSCGVGAGLWMPDPPRLEKLRAHFAKHHARYRAVADDNDYAAHFDGGQSPRYKRVPKPYEADHPAADLLTLKGIHISTELDAALITSAELVPTIGRYFGKLAPLVALLDEALAA